MTCEKMGDFRTTPNSCLRTLFWCVDLQMYFSTKLISFREYDDNKVATYVLDLICSNYFDYITQTRQTYEHLGKFKGMERQYKMNLSCAKLFQWNQVTIGAVNGQVLKSTKS